MLFAKQIKNDFLNVSAGCRALCAAMCADRPCAGQGAPPVLSQTPSCTLCCLLLSPHPPPLHAVIFSSFAMFCVHEKSIQLLSWVLALYQMAYRKVALFFWLFEL